MKVTKIFMRNLLLIILACFVLLPFILMYMNLNDIESFTSIADGSYNTTIEGVDISGILLTDSAGSYTGLSGESMYCIGSNVECSGASYTKTEVGTDPLGIKLYQ